MMWHPPTKAQADGVARRLRNVGHLLQRDLEGHIEQRILYGDRKNVPLEEWERDYLKALLENNRSWLGTAKVLQQRLDR